MIMMDAKKILGFFVIYAILYSISLHDNNHLQKFRDMDPFYLI